MMFQRSKKLLTVFLIAIMAAALAAGTVTASAAPWWGENPYDASVYAWDTAAVDANRWITRSIPASTSWSAGSNYGGVNEDGYTYFETANQSDMFNSTALTLEDGVAINLTYKADSALGAGDPDFGVFVMTERAYKSNRPMRWDANNNNAGAYGVKIDFRGTSASIGDTIEWSGLTLDEYHTIEIYFAEDAADSWAAIDGARQLINVPRSYFQDYTESGYTGNGEPTGEKVEGSFTAYIGMHTTSLDQQNKGINMEVSAPSMEEYSSEEITMSATRVNMAENDTYALTATDNFEAGTYTWTSSNNNIATVENGTVTAVSAGTATITASAETDWGGTIRATASVYVYEFDDPNGWMTTEAAADAWSRGQAKGHAVDYAYDEASGTTSLWLGDSCDFMNKTAFDFADGPVTFTADIGVGTGTEGEDYLIFELSSEREYRTYSLFSYEYLSPVNLFIRYSGAEIVYGSSDAGENIRMDGSCTVGEEVTITLYIGTGESGDESFVVINGVYQALSVTRDDYTGGTGYITIYSNDAREMAFSAFSRESVVTISENTLSLMTGGTQTLTAALHPADASASFVWESSDNTIVTVENGTVTAVKAGTATVTVTSGNSSASCVVTVTDPVVTSVRLDKTELSLTVGGSATLTATYEPADAVNTEMSWLSSNTAVATVENGTVTAVSAGTATITVSCGGYTATCTVTVTEADAGNTAGGCSSAVTGGMLAVCCGVLAGAAVLLAVKRKKSR
mgnify:CR=1 FL=1